CGGGQAGHAPRRAAGAPACGRGRRMTRDEGIERDRIEKAEDAMEEGGLGRLLSPRAILLIVAGIAVAIVGLYVLLPKLVGVHDAINRIGDAKWYWIVVAFAFVTLAFVAYAAVFRGIVGAGDDEVMHERLTFRASYEIP